MKRLKLSKELFFGSVLIGVLSIGLVSCGGGGGGGGSVSTSQPSTLQPSSSSTSQLNLSFSAPIYQGTDWQNEPIITVYIDGQPVQLLVDTGQSGLVVNQSAVNIPSSDYTSYTFNASYGDASTVSGTLASATVCLNPSITNTCVVMPIGVNTSGTAFSGSAQGDFGLAPLLFTQDMGSSSGSFLYAYSYPTYLAQEYGINSFTISFFPLSNTFYAYVSSTTPIGEISFGTNPPSTYLPFSSDGITVFTQVAFPSYTSSISSDTQPAVFDTGANFNFLTKDVLYREIPNLSSSDENNCLSGVMQINTGGSNTGSVVNGGFNIAYQILSLSTSLFSATYTTYYSTTFTTEPPAGFCSSGVQWNVMIGNTVDAGYFGYGNYNEVFGLPEMLRHTFVWVLDNQGFVQGISIDPQ